MLNYVVKKLDTGRSAGKGGKSTVRSTRVRDSAGKSVNFRTVDVSSDSLTEDLTMVFGRNVERARRENRKVLGVTDVAPAR